MKTTRWPVGIVIFYFIINTVLIIPIAKICFGEEEWYVDELLPYGMILGAIMLLAQVFLFQAKIDIVEKRPITRRSISGTTITTALLMALMTLLLFFILIFVIYGERQSPLSVLNEYTGLGLIILVFVLSWVLWARLFFKMYRNNAPDTYLTKMVNTAMAGSVLELLIAIPSHIIMRNRGDCCAPGISFLGILMGIAVALFAFGPGLVFLYLKRMNDKRPRSQKPE